MNTVQFERLSYRCAMPWCVVRGAWCVVRRRRRAGTPAAAAAAARSRSPQQGASCAQGGKGARAWQGRSCSLLAARSSQLLRPQNSQASTSEAKSLASLAEVLPQCRSLAGEGRAPLQSSTPSPSSSVSVRRLAVPRGDRRWAGAAALARHVLASEAIRAKKGRLAGEIAGTPEELPRRNWIHCEQLAPISSD